MLFGSLVCYENNLRERMRTKNMERHIGVPKQYIGSFSLSRNKEINSKPSSGRGQENEML